MRNLFLTAAAGMALAFLSLPANAGGETPDDETAAICAEAAARLKDISPTPPVDPGAVLVLTYKYHFCPGKLTVKAGTKVQWINAEKRTSHSVWLKEAGIPESERFYPNEGWSYTFTKPGEYPYMCGPHGIDEKMTGSLTVTP